MDDLVNRLRGIYAVGPEGVYGTRSFADFIPPISLEAADRISELETSMREIYEVWAGSEGIVTTTTPEAYQTRLIEEMRDIAAKHLPTI